MIESRKNYRILVMAILLAGICFLTYYFHAILKTGRVFTHFFYIPIILAALWWRKKGLTVAVFLAGLLILNHIFVRGETMTTNDYLRALMFIVIASVVATLSVMIAKTQQRATYFNAVLHAIRNVNQFIIKERDRNRLLQGICDRIIETRGYSNTWIILLDDVGKLMTSFQAGLGDEFLTMIELLKQGKLTRCGQKALMQSDVVVIKNPPSECTNCPLAENYKGRAGMSIRLAYDGKAYGIMAVSIPANLARDEEEQSLFKEVAGDVGFALHTIELEERRKQEEEKMEHLSRVLRATRNVNQLIVREKDRDRLLQSTCENLTETKGYHNAWIALMDENNRPMTLVEAGIGKDFLFMVEKLKRGELTACGKKALTQSEIVVTEDPLSSCTDCPLVAHYADRGAMCIRLEHAGKIYGLLSVSIPTYLITNEEEHTLLREIAEDVAFALHNMVLEKEHKKAEDRLKESYELLQKTLGGTVHALASTVGKRDPFTQSHQLKVTKLACCIAEELHLSKDRIKGLRFAGLLHDIGKISVPAEILSKPGRLTNAEYRIIKTHAQHAYDILKDIEFPWPIANVVLQHHERLDGSGYPQGLKDSEILLEAKILAVADVVEAMSSHRPYRPAPGVEKALAEIKKNRGILYESRMVDICIQLFKQHNFNFNLKANGVKSSL